MFLSNNIVLVLYVLNVKKMLFRKKITLILTRISKVIILKKNLLYNALNILLYFQILHLDILLLIKSHIYIYIYIYIYILYNYIHTLIFLYIRDHYFM